MCLVDRALLSGAVGQAVYKVEFFDEIIRVQNREGTVADQTIRSL